MGDSIEMIPAEWLTRAVAALFEEAYVGPPDPRSTWFVDNEPQAGLLGVLEGIDAATAGSTPGSPSSVTLASHVGHLQYALQLANRASRGENPYPGAKWDESWKARVGDEDEWRELLAGFRAEYEAFRTALATGELWTSEELLALALAQVAHGAWHLGAIRQALGRVAAP